VSKNNIVSLKKAELAYRAYVSGGFKVTSLIVWFKAELSEHAISMKKYSHYNDDMLARHTRHVEHLAREMRESRQLEESLKVA
jgi:hypothetical protein